MTYFKRIQVTDLDTGQVVKEWETNAELADVAQKALVERIALLGYNFRVDIGDLS